MEAGGSRHVAGAQTPLPQTRWRHGGVGAVQPVVDLEFGKDRG
jgi:hypothetical protein